MKRFLLVILSIQLFCCPVLFAQSNIHPVAENIFSKSGLGFTNATAIVQDQSGFIWIGTSSGLYKYDGYTMIPFASNKEGKILLNQEIKGLYYDHQNNLWIIHAEAGISRYNIFSDKLDFFVADKKNPNSLATNRVTQIVQDKNNVYWIATQNGLDKLSFTTEQDKEVPHFVHYQNSNEGDNHSILSNKINGLVLDAADNVWCATLKGVCVLNQKTNAFSYHQEIIDKLNQPVSVTCLSTDKQNNIWLGTATDGVWRYNEKKDSSGFKGMQRIFFSTELLNNGVKSILVENNTHLWIAAANDYLIDYNLQVHSVNKFEKSAGLTGSNFNTLFHDKSGMIWIAHENGVDKIVHNNNFENINLTTLPFNLRSNSIVYALLEDERKNLWIGTDNEGVVRYNSGDNSVTKYSIASPYGKQLLSNEIYSLEQDAMNIYVGSRRGLNIINKATGLVSALPPTSFPLDINTMYLDKSKSTLWIGIMNYGLCKLDTRTMQTQFITDPEKIKDVTSNNDVKAIYVDKEGMIWLGTDYGLKIYNPQSNTYLRYRNDKKEINSISNNQVSCIYEDDKQNVWLGTSGGGLNKFERLNQKITRFDKNNILASNVEMNAITGDNQGNLWISTNIGLVKYNPANNLFFPFDKNDGILSSEFNVGSFYRNEKGMLFFGALDAITSFTPDSINIVNSPLMMSINKVFFGTKQFDIDYSDVNKPSIELTYKDVSFTIDFISINYSNSDKTQYAYYLEGFNKEWVTSGSSHFTGFTNLSPGTYKFHFKSSTGEGNWKESPQVLTIVITPPFWKTWWFYAFVFITLLLIGMFVYKSREARLKERKAKELAIQSTKMKQQFLANMSHEIRTPMNAVVGFTELLSNTSVDEEQKSYVSAIKNSAANLLIIINDILDYSKLDAGKVELSRNPFYTKAVIDKVYSTLFLKAKEKKLRFLINIDNDIPELLIGDEVRLCQILINLLNNSIKFTHSGYVSLDIKTVSKLDSQIIVKFIIGDTGIGIAPEKLPNIFESFTQATNDTSRLYGGTGLGLAISKQLVELQKGKIEVQSEVNKGTEFIITIPFDFAVMPLVNPTLIEKAKPQIGAGLIKNIKEEKLSILIAEDNQFNQLLAKNVITKNFPNATIMIAENGQQAVDLLGENQFDLVLMDIQMPVMSGIEAAKAIRASNNGIPKNIPIIACTAGVTPAEIQDCFAAGMNDFIGKPFKPDEMVAKIEKLFNP